MRPSYRTSLLLTVSAVLVALLAASAHAQHPRMRPPTPQPTMLPGVAEVRMLIERADEFGLSKEKQATAKALLAEVEGKGRQLKEDTTKGHVKLWALLDDPIPDEKTLFEAASVATASYAAQRELRLRTTLRVRALLSKEELAKFMEARKTEREMNGRKGRKGRKDRKGKKGAKRGDPQGAKAGASEEAAPKDSGPAPGS